MFGDTMATISVASEIISLLHIIRKLDSDRLMCSLDTFRLEDAPLYTTLSYVWGEEPADRVIALNGRPVKVARNLHRVLQYLSNRDSGALWVDALCIDQSNLQEKSRQVQLLGKIYRSSRATLVYLGGAVDEQTYHQFVLKRIARRSSEEFFPEQAAAALGRLELLSNPWFRRIWTLQEALLSRDIIFILKSEELGWEDFWTGIFPTCEYLQYLSTYALDSITHALRLNLIVRSSKPSQQLLGCTRVQQLRNILLHQSTIDSTDPREKVFSLYSVLQLFDIKLPPPEYSKSVDQVFQEAAMSVQMMLTAPADTEGINGIDRLLADCPTRWAVHDHDSYYQELVNNFIKALTAIRSYHSASTIPDDAFRNAEYMASDSDCDAENIRTLRDTGATHFSDDLVSEYSVLFDQLVGGLREVLSRNIAAYLKDPSAQKRLMTCNDGDNNSNGEIRSNNSSEIAGKRSHGDAKATNSKDKTDKFQKRPVEEEEDEEDFDRRPSKQLRDQVDIWDRLACPYFQRNSQGPRILGACRGLGFDKLSRLKEHLYRDHLIYPCGRCGAISRTPGDLQTHLRQPEPCTLIDWKPTFDRAQGFDNEQQKDIRRKTIRSWQAVFKILFPEDAEHTYPPQHHRNPQFIQLFDQFQAHYHEEIQRLIPDRLLGVPFLAALPLAEQYSVQVAITNIASDIHRQVVGSFRSNVLRASQGTDFSDTPNRLFLDYLGHVAPEGALPNNSLAAEVGNSDFSSLFPGVAFPSESSIPWNPTEETWYMVDEE